MAKLQELYMLDLDQSKALAVHDSIQQSNLLQLATPEMLAVSQPPASFPVPQTAKASTIVPALHEIETLRRERGSLKEQVRRSHLSFCTTLFRTYTVSQEIYDQVPACNAAVVTLEELSFHI